MFALRLASMHCLLVAAAAAARSVRRSCCRRRCAQLFYYMHIKNGRMCALGYSRPSGGAAVSNRLRLPFNIQRDASVTVRQKGGRTSGRRSKVGPDQSRRPIRRRFAEESLSERNSMSRKQSSGGAAHRPAECGLFGTFPWKTCTWMAGQRVITRGRRHGQEAGATGRAVEDTWIFWSTYRTATRWTTY